MDTNSLEIGTTATTHIYWYDETKSILIHEVLNHWTWTDAHESISIVNNTIRAHQEPVYTIHKFHPTSSVMPTGSLLANLRRLMMDDPPNEQLVIVVGASTMVETFIKTVSQAYGLFGIVPKYRYVKTLPEALRLIEKYKVELSQSHKPA